MITKIKDKSDNVYVTVEYTEDEDKFLVEVEYLSGKPAATVELYVDRGVLWVRSLRHSDSHANAMRIATLYF